MAESCTYTLFTNNTNLGKFSDVIRKSGSNDFLTLQQECTYKLASLLFVNYVRDILYEGLLYQGYHMKGN